jgi:hypothetical protein
MWIEPANLTQISPSKSAQSFPCNRSFPKQLKPLARHGAAKGSGVAEIVVNRCEMRITSNLHHGDDHTCKALVLGQETIYTPSGYIEKAVPTFKMLYSGAQTFAMGVYNYDNARFNFKHNVLSEMRQGMVIYKGDNLPVLINAQSRTHGLCLVI